MTKPWLCRIHLTNVDRVADVRAEPGIQVATDLQHFWLRGEDLKDALLIKLQSVADGPVFRLINDYELVPDGSHVPTETLPELQWNPLSTYSQLLLPVAAVPHAKVPRCQLTLVRSGRERPAELLITDFTKFASWALAAATIRLQRCQFAVMDDVKSLESATCLVKGTPLPSIQGQRFWLAGRIAIPLGFEWSPSVDETTFDQVLIAQQPTEISSQDILLWRRSNAGHDDSTCVVPSSAFHPATRQCIRRLQRDGNEESRGGPSD